MQSKKILAAALIATIFAASCKKDTAISRPNTSPTVSKFSDLVSDPYANPNNPYDNIGYLHNQLVDYLVQNKWGQGSTYTQFTSLVDQFDRTNLTNIDWKSYAATSPAMQSFVVNLPTTATIPNYDKAAYASALRTEQSKGGITTNVTQNLLTFAGLLDYQSAYSSQTMSTVVANVTKQIIAQEQVVLNSTMPDNDKMQILEVSSVMRHSLNYWVVSQGTGGEMALDSWWSTAASIIMADVGGASTVFDIAAAGSAIPGLPAAILLAGAAAGSAYY